MFLLLVLSTVLLVLYISSLRFIIKTGKNYVIREEIQKLESHIPDESESGSAVSFSLVFSLVIAVILNLVEIGYFVYCSYFFNDTVITVGSSILIGYTLYSMIQFLPVIKKVIQKPLTYLKEKSRGFEAVLSLVMVSLEILFCLYVMLKIFINFILTG